MTILPPLFFLVTMNMASMNTVVQILFWAYVFSSLC